MRRHALVIVMLMASSLLVGCSLMQRMQEQSGSATQVRKNVEKRTEDFQQSTSGQHARLHAQRVNRPWLVSRSVPVARELTLPPALRKNVDTTMMYRAGKTDLVTLAERITQATGIPVSIKPEALLSAEGFLPRLAITTQTPVVAMPHQAAFAKGPQPLPKALDALSRRLGIYWRYHNEAIEFYRTQTRVFDVRVFSLAAQSEAQLGRSPSNKAGGFDNTSRTALRTPEQHPLDAIKLRIEPFLTRAGIIVAQPGASTSVVVTDTPDALDAVAVFLERENRAMTRRVRLIFEEITIATNEDLEFGLDWDAVLSQGNIAAGLSSPVLGIGVGAARANVGAASRVVQSSQLVMNALSKYGTVLRHTSIPVLTLNRRPVTHAVRSTFSYIDQIKSSTSAGLSGAAGLGGLASSSLSQKEETVGSFLTLVPDAQEDGQILLSVAYDNTVAQPLKTITFGEQGQRVQIQQVTIDGTGTVQQVALRAGQPMLISGFDRKQDEATQARLAPDIPLLFGGSNRSAQTRTATLIMVTAQIEDGF
jgi:type IVB pilus formation R64 PilN family outer membrane protein